MCSGIQGESQLIENVTCVRVSSASEEVKRSAKKSAFCTHALLKDAVNGGARARRGLPDHTVFSEIQPFSLRLS